MQSYVLAAIALSLSFAGLDTPHDPHELPEQPTSQPDAHQTHGRGGDRGGDHQRQRGDEDLEREERLEAEHRPVAPPVHALGEREEDEREKHGAGNRAPAAAEVVDGRRAGDHGKRHHDAYRDRNQQGYGPLVLAEGLEAGTRLLLAAGRRHYGSRGSAPGTPWSVRAAVSGSSASAIARSTTALR